MARNRILERAGAAQGFTLMEMMTVCAIIGVMATMAWPSIRRFNLAQETKSSATKMAGVLEEARSRAISEGTPHLVFVSNPTTSGSANGNGNCGTMAVIVRDSDRSYSITDGDKVREFSLPPEACNKVKLYGQDATATPFEDLRLPAEDQAVLGQSLLQTVASTTTDPNTLVGGITDNSGEGSSSSGEDGSSEGSSETLLRTEEVAASVVNGSTFPIDQASGRPVIAFSERGIPVDPSRPTSWGSGAGAIYLTDGQDSVYAAVVQPMGGIKIRKYEPASQQWR